MHVDGALVDIDVAAPDAVEQLFAAEHAARMLEEEFEQAIFGRAEIDRTARTRNAALVAIEFDVAIGQHGGEPFGAGTAQQRLHPRQEFRHRERLDDVIVRAGGEAAYALAFLAARGEHDDRQLLGFRPRPQPTAQFDAGEARQHPVQHHEIGNAFLQPRIGIVAAHHDFDVIAFGVEVVTQQRRQRFLVFDYKNACVHLLLSITSRERRRRRSGPLSAACRGSADLRPCRPRSRRYWWRGRRSARYSWHRTSGGYRS